MIPDECKMPDLSDLDFPLKRYLIIPALIGDPGITKKEGLYRRNFVRLVDKAVKEYQEARNSIIAQIDESKRPIEEMMQGRIFYIAGFPDHFETCLNALNRLLNQLDKIKSESGSWRTPREIRRSIEAHSKAIPDIRNSAEHMEGDIEGDLEEGQPVMLSIGGSGEKAVLAGHEIMFSDVAAAIRALHKIALDLFEDNQTAAL